MSAPLRIALVTRRFWPLVGGAEVMVANLAVQLRQEKCEVVILTAQWEPDWPAEIVHREVPVLRLPNPPQRGWGTFRYMVALGRWLRTHHRQWDVVYVSMLKHDAYVAVRALGPTTCPVVLRAEGGGETGDCHWQRTARFGMRIRRQCYQADAVVAPSQAIAQELLDADYPPERIHYVPNGVMIAPPRDEARRTSARRALAEANSDLLAPLEAPVAVYTGRLHHAKGLLDLVEGWVRVVQRRPNARLWLIGDGPLRSELYARVVDLDLRHSVVMPGAFDQVDDTLEAADLFILPSYQEGLSIALLEAMAAGLPSVVTDIPGNREIVRDEQEGLLVPPGHSAGLAAAILRLLESPALARQLGQQARQRIMSEFSLEQTARKHLELFHKCRKWKKKSGPLETH